MGLPELVCSGYGINTNLFLSLPNFSNAGDMKPENVLLKQQGRSGIKVRTHALASFISTLRLFVPHHYHISMFRLFAYVCTITGGTRCHRKNGSFFKIAHHAF